MLYDMDSKEVGALIRSQRHGDKVSSLVKHLPFLHVDTSVQPITRSILRCNDTTCFRWHPDVDANDYDYGSCRLVLTIQTDFIWLDRYHGMAEPFW